uniref:MHD domain-containing protein n=1 Tax=Rhodosorus marinus TaxID=101924 RepID=A0A7S0BPA5_9RHOD|mmetsp:Transcript_3165/g.4534  ORF Transcript_3165/g.4534 Transcript_3165/m.4534 type:complete len:243 (+) Transcript_3165:78-806(+)
MINSLFILNGNGEVIIEKHYRGNTKRVERELLWAEVLKARTPQDVPPVLSTTNGVIIHIHKNNLFFVASVRRDVMPLVVVEFLMRVADIFVDYFGELNENAIKDNFITVYELLDEMLDNELPLNMEPSILKELVKPPDPIAKMIETVTGDSRSNTELPQSSLTNVPWRRRGIRYMQHEIFVDIVEEIDALVSRSGKTVQMQVCHPSQSLQTSLESSACRTVVSSPRPASGGTRGSSSAKFCS